MSNLLEKIKISGPTQISTLDQDSTKELQSLLSKAGFDVGCVDGIYGAKTASAFFNFKALVNSSNPTVLGAGSLTQLIELSNHAVRAVGTGPGSNPKSTPKNSNKLPAVPSNLKYFRVPGMSEQVHQNSPIYFQGNPTNFTWGEATKNGSRIPVDSNITSNIIKLAGYMDKVRDYLGNKPIGITSWYRDPDSNRSVGGATRSQHLVGNAVDFYIVGEDVVDTFTKMKRYHTTSGLACGSDFIHVDLRPGGPVRWTYPGGPNVDLW